jgi:hypothetical protein
MMTPMLHHVKDVPAALRTSLTKSIALYMLSWVDNGQVIQRSLPDH